MFTVCCALAGATFTKYHRGVSTTQFLALTGRECILGFVDVSFDEGKCSRLEHENISAVGVVVLCRDWESVAGGRKSRELRIRILAWSWSMGYVFPRRLQSKLSLLLFP